MADLTPITALGGRAPRVERHGGATCTEVTDLALAAVAARAGQEPACVAALTALIGAPPPGPGQAHLAAPFAAVWSGPGQWFVGADLARYDDLAAEVKARLGATASVTEQTDAWAIFDLAGYDITPVLALLCNLDLRRFAAGAATRTRIHHIGCFALSGGPGFVRLLGPRSMAASLHHAITTAMRSAL